MKQVPFDPETQFSEMLAQFDEALATASDASSVLAQPFVSSLANADLQLRFDRVHNCLQLLEQDRRRQTAKATKDNLAPEQAAVPHQIGRFRVIRRLGSGGFGVVFLAEDPVLRRNVAIKMPLASIFQSQELHDRFLRECRGVLARARSARLTLGGKGPHQSLASRLAQPRHSGRCPAGRSRTSTRLSGTLA
jgi:hypothetical protein